MRSDGISDGVIPSRLDMLEAQGIKVIVPRPGRLPRADLAVLPEPSSPEHRYYRPLLEEAGIPHVSHRDPLTGLALALAYPLASLGSLVAGIDPGRRCGLVVLGGTLVIHASKVLCESIGRELHSLLARIPHSQRMILLGDGEGVMEAAASLEQEGLSYRLVHEWGSTSSPARGPVEDVLKDKDLLAGLTIALRGVVRRV